MQRVFLSFAALALLAGCSVSPSGAGITLRIPISGGQLVPIAVSNGSAVRAEDDKIKVEQSIFEQQDKHLAGRYLFALYEKQGDPPRRIRVDDVTEEDQPPASLVDDPHPALKNGHWAWTCPDLPLTDPSLLWLRQIDQSLRIYRYTVENSDGSVDVLYDGQDYPIVLKEFFKKQVDDAAAAPAAASRPD